MLVRLFGALGVGVALDADAADPGVLAEHVGHLVEQAEAARPDRGPAAVEVHLVEDDDRLLGDEDAGRAAVGALRIGVGRARGVGALVAHVGDAVAVAVGAAEGGGRAGLAGALVVGVDEAVAVSVGAALQLAGDVRAGVDLVGETVAVGVGAATRAHRTGEARTLVGAVGDAVAVVVGLGAAVVVLPAVVVFGLVGAIVVAVGDAVAVVVGLGAAVGVLPAVHVLGAVGAAVELVGDAVLVAVHAVVTEAHLDARGDLAVGADGALGVGDVGASRDGLAVDPEPESLVHRDDQAQAGVEEAHGGDEVGRGVAPDAQGHQAAASGDEGLDGLVGEDVQRQAEPRGDRVVGQGVGLGGAGVEAHLQLEADVLVGPDRQAGQGGEGVAGLGVGLGDEGAGLQPEPERPDGAVGGVGRARHEQQAANEEVEQDARHRSPCRRLGEAAAVSTLLPRFPARDSPVADHDRKRATARATNSVTLGASRRLWG